MERTIGVIERFAADKEFKLVFKLICELQAYFKTVLQRLRSPVCSNSPHEFGSYVPHGWTQLG
jgi:hypothetical protein